MRGLVVAWVDAIQVPLSITRRVATISAAVAIVVASCSQGGEDLPEQPPDSVSTTSPAASTTAAPGPEVVEGRAIPPSAGQARNQLGFEFPAAPEAPDGPLDGALVDELDAFFGTLQEQVDLAALEAIGESTDPRAAWLLADLLRFVTPGTVQDIAVSGFEKLTGASLAADPVARRSVWQSVTDHLIAWDLPAPPGYVGWKADLFALAEPRWAAFFEDEDADIDWRWVSWGGVRLDDRPLGATQPCPLGCIPALDDPPVTGAADGGWYPDDAIVFGVVVGTEARAYPKNMMEVHEMVNDTLGGRRLGIPYCTLCGSAQAYFTDSVPAAVDVPLLRTSGLLSRSNKVMFDLNTFSVFDTFTGRALSGPLQDEGVVLEQTTVVTSAWGAWKAEHPDTTIIAEDGGIGRTYPLDPLRGRDDAGPIFPIGDVDERLPVQAPVFGVESADGTHIAFPIDEAKAALEAGTPVALQGITLESDGSGLRAFLDDGTEVVGHQSFWFAWSQFHPETLVWAAPLLGGD